MMTQHVNHFENQKEALIRLRNTIVLYDGEPFYVVGICNHNDGVMRMYMMPSGVEGTVFPPQTGAYGSESVDLRNYLDGLISQNFPGLIRRMMNSPLFNKFRPFPLGMCNVGAGVVYTERQPTRKTEQGLVQQMVSSQPVSLNAGFGGGIDIHSPAFRSTILGKYPTAQECLTNLTSGDYENTAAAFHREFAFVKGPIGVVFLAYKSDIVGTLPGGSLNQMRLGKNSGHLREVIENLKLFHNIEG